MDGGEVKGYGYSYPNRKKENGKFGFDRKVFYSPNAALWWLTRVEAAHPHLRTYLQLHVRRDLGIEGEIIMSPDPGTLEKYTRNGQGLTEAQFRAHGNTCMYVEKIEHLAADKRVWVQEAQTDHSRPFYETIRDETVYANLLLSEHIAKGQPIPKALQEDANRMLAAKALEQKRFEEEAKHGEAEPLPASMVQTMVDKDDVAKEEDAKEDDEALEPEEEVDERPEEEREETEEEEEREKVLRHDRKHNRQNARVVPSPMPSKKRRS